jgi:sialate O-acetylesterase
LREAQEQALALPRTGQAVTIDLGEEGEVHYRNKRDVGKRLALIAFAKTYGIDQMYSGPVYDSFHVEGNAIRVAFREINGGLFAKPLPAYYRPMSIKPIEKRGPALGLGGRAHRWRHRCCVVRRRGGSRGGSVWMVRQSDVQFVQ